jgi:hypothetical protein
VERFRDQEVLIVEDENRNHLRRSVLHFNPGRDLPMILAVRNAAFISHGQLFSQLVSQGTESNRQGFCWRLKRLVDTGLIQRLPQIMPYSGATYTITRAGLICLESCGEGLVSITSESRSLPNSRQAAHYLELGEIRVGLRKAGILRRWISDIELRSMNLSIDLPLAKDYDAVAELAIEHCMEVSAGIEYERTLKGSQRYREIVKAVKEEKQLDLLVYLTSSVDLVYQLRAEFEELDFPTVFAPSGAFRRNPLDLPMYCTLFRGPKKVTLAEIVSVLPRH